MVVHIGIHGWFKYGEFDVTVLYYWNWDCLHLSSWEYLHENWNQFVPSRTIILYWKLRCFTNYTFELLFEQSFSKYNAKNVSHPVFRDWRHQGEGWMCQKKSPCRYLVLCKQSMSIEKTCALLSLCWYLLITKSNGVFLN